MVNALLGSSINSFEGIDVSKIISLFSNPKKSQDLEPGSIPITRYNKNQVLFNLLIIKVQYFFLFLLIFNTTEKYYYPI